MSKSRIAALGASAASAALVGSALFAPAAMAQEQEPSPSAYAIGAEGLVQIAKTPHATGTEDPQPVASVPGDPLVTAEALDSASAPGESSSKVLGLNAIELPPGVVPGDPKYLIEADVLTASCTGGDVTSDIALLKIAGNEIPVDTSPNTGIPAPLDQVIDITVNEQIDNPDGSTTVNAVSITVLEGADQIAGNTPILGKLAGQTITLASATCGPKEDGGETTPPTTTPPENGDDNGNGDNGDDGKGNGDDAEEDGTAPTPTPKPDHIAVTG